MFDFATIKPKYDVLVCASEGDVDNFWMRFASIDLKLSIRKELELNSFWVYDLTVANYLWIKPPAGLDLIQVMERICTTLEMQGYKVERKIAPRGKLLDDAKPLQSFILG